MVAYQKQQNINNADKHGESTKKEVKSDNTDKTNESTIKELKRSQKESDEPKPSTSYEGATNYHQVFKNNIYYQIVPVTLKNKGKERQTFADAGSSLTLMEEEVANELSLEGRTNPLKLTWTQNVTRESESRQVQVSISGPSKQNSLSKE